MVPEINEDGLINEKPAVVSFKLLPPIWQRWWFVLGVAIILVSSVITLDRFRAWKTRQVKVALRQTIESETRYRTLAEAASDAIITIDESSKIIYANEAAEHVFGYRADEMIGEPLTKLMPQADGHGLMSIKERAAVLAGDLNIQSQRGKGTSIQLRVPLNPNSGVASV